MTLKGEVDWQYQKLDAERAVRRLTGVKGVTNLIVVTPKASPSHIKHKIEDALVGPHRATHRQSRLTSREAKSR